jgi:hypothetical protein
MISVYQCDISMIIVYQYISMIKVYQYDTSTISVYQYISMITVCYQYISISV